MTGHTGPVNALAALPAPGGTTVLASSSHDATIRLWSPTTQEPAIRPLTGHVSGVLALTAVSLPDGTELLVSAGTDHTVLVWDLAAHLTDVWDS